MASKVLIMDTSMLSCWLKIPGKQTCGPVADAWDYDRVEHHIKQEIASGCTLVLPVATLIETGNHIAHAVGDRFALAKGLTNILMRSVDDEEPWAAFEHQAGLWNKESLTALANEWPDLAAQGLGIGDATIKDVAEYYARTGTVQVEILTGDRGLKAHEPRAPTPVPRRRRSKNNA